MFRAASRCVLLMLPGVGGVRGWGGVQGFHFEAKMDACAHFFSLPPWPYLGSYIMLVNTGRPMLGLPVPSICSFMWGGAPFIHDCCDGMPAICVAARFITKFLHRHLMQLADSFSRWYIAVTISSGVLFFT